MNSYKKKKIKKILKEKWGWFLASGIFLAVGIVALLIGFNMTGWSLIKWLQSPYAVTFFILLAIGIICAITLFITYKRAHLGGDE